MTVDVAVQTESQNSNSVSLEVGSSEACTLQTEISTESVESAKPSESETCTLQHESFTESVKSAKKLSPSIKPISVSKQPNVSEEQSF